MGKSLVSCFLLTHGVYTVYGDKWLKDVREPASLYALTPAECIAAGAWLALVAII